MKHSTFKNRTRKFSKASKGYQFAELILKGETLRSWEKAGKFYTCHTSGRGRITINLDYTDDTIKVLEAAGLKKNVDFIVDNDSPRGGLTGNYVQLTSKGKRKMIKNAS
jgi:hypothetical protein